MVVELKTSKAVFKELKAAMGSLEKIKDLTSRRDIRVVSNWKIRGFPPDTYWVVSMELKKHGFKVDPKVFGMSHKLVPEDA